MRDVATHVTLQSEGLAARREAGRGDHTAAVAVVELREEVVAVDGHACVLHGPVHTLLHGRVVQAARLAERRERDNTQSQYRTFSRKEGNVLFNDAYMVNDHSDSERGNQLPPHRLLFPISSKGSFICTIPQPMLHQLWKEGNVLFTVIWGREREMFYLTTHSTHFIYGYMASDIWLRTILIARKETRCCHIGYSFRLAARVLLYAPSQTATAFVTPVEEHWLKREIAQWVHPWGIDPMSHHTMSEHPYHGATSRSKHSQM